MSLRSLGYLMREGIHSALRNRALSVAALVSTVASLLVLAIVLLITSNLERQASSIESRRVMDVYLADRITETDRLTLEKKLREIPGITRVTHVSKNDAPIFIVHGDQDPLVPLAQSEVFLAALKKAGVDADLHVVKGGGHGGFKDPEVDVRVRAFFDRVLKSSR